MANYPDFIESTGYGDVQGLCGANCRHSFGPYIENLSPETYSAADLDKMSSATVTYTDWRTGNEVTVPYYDGTQIQRGLERKVRHWKERVAVRESGGVDASTEKQKLKLWRKRLKTFVEETGLKRDPVRERIAKP